MDTKTMHTSIALGLTGLLISGYLLYRYMVLTSGIPSAGADVCSLVFGQGCDATLRSPASFFLGLPMSGWGMVYFAVLVSTLLLGSFIGKAYSRETHVLTFWIAGGGMAMSVLLLGMMLFGNVALCPLCIAIHLINAVVLFLQWRAAGGPGHNVLYRTRRWIKVALSGAIRDVRHARWRLAVSVVPLLVGAVTYQWVYIEATPHRSTVLIDPVEVVETFKGSPVFDLPVTWRDATLGPDNARHTLVIFSDFQCPSCREFGQGVHALATQYPRELRIVFKHFPLDPACNPRMERNLHAGACEAAYLAQAALRQNKFWELHDVLFSAPFERDDLDSLIRIAGVDVELLQRDKNDLSVTRKVTDDIMLTDKLEITSTPAVFLDGRRLKDRRPQVLSILIESAS